MTTYEICDGCGEHLVAGLITDGGICIACADYDGLLVEIPPQKRNDITNRPTPAQDDLVAYVTFHPGCRPAEAAREIGPHGSYRYGYETIKRAIAAGRIINLPDPVRPDWGCLYAT